jgi:succinoglycan biosynthesis transport protein ExoP
MPQNPPPPPHQASGQIPYGTPGGPGYGGYGAGGGGGYGGYGGYGYGYPGGSDEGAVQRQFRDYVLILRERMWYIITVFLLVFASAAAFTYSRTKLYEASASVQVMRRDPTVMQVQQVQDTDIRSAEDLNTQVKVLESLTMIQRVAADLKGDDLARFKAPYPTTDGKPVNVERIIELNRKVVPARLTLLVAVQYQHPDPEIAAKVANYFVDEYISYNTRQRVTETLKAVEELKPELEKQREKVNKLNLALQEYREKRGMVSLQQNQDVVTDKLKKLSSDKTDAEAQRSVAELRWNQIREIQAKNGDLLSLDTIASLPNIAELRKKLTDQSVEISGLRERYRDLHPTMQEALKKLTSIQTELKTAIASAAATFESAYQNAVRRDNEAKKALEKATADANDLNRAAVDYKNASTEYEVENQLLTRMVSRFGEASMSGSIETQNARIIDRSRVPTKPIYPNTPLNLALGVLGGLGLGLAVAFFVAYIDDRVKSAYDIEGVVGLPLLGIIPEVEKLVRSERAQIADNHLDKRVAEAFYALHAALQLKNESKNAQCFLVTSTVPGEGKSFVSSNLAITFASHGERTVLIDCDLRKPTQHRLLQSDHAKGVIDFCVNNSPLDEIIAKDVKPGLDLIGSGGRAKSPTQVLNSRAFENMISELRKRYDRIIVDTPPLAAVTDALIVLPLMDASIYSIFFNKVRRKAAQFCAHQMQDANIPCCGAVLNGLNLDISGYYYAQYYDKSYQSYYGESGKKKRRVKSTPENNDPDSTPLR